MSRGLVRRVVDVGTSTGLRLVRWLREPDRPLLGVEFHADSVGVLRLAHQGGRRQLAAAATVRLSPGALVPSMARANIVDTAAVQAAVRQAVERVGGLMERRVALTLPDGIARIVVLSEADLGDARGTALEEVVRFRLREKVPFDIRQAAVAWDLIRPAQAAAGPGALIAVATLRSVLEEYEGIVRSIGLTPGLVEISGLALLRALSASEAPGDWLTLNWDEAYFSVFLTRSGVPLLARTVGGAISMDAVVRELSNTILYHRERLGGQGLAGARVRLGQIPSTEALDALGQAVGLAPTVIDPLAGLGVKASEDVSQAVAGVACVLMAGGA